MRKPLDGSPDCAGEGGGGKRSNEGLPIIGKKRVKGSFFLKAMCHC